MGRNVSAAALTFGSDASIDDAALKSVAIWVQPDNAAGDDDRLIGKATGAATWDFSIQRDLAAEANAHLRYQNDFATADGDWDSANNTVTINAQQQVGMTYDRGNVANDPQGYVNGTAVAMPSVAVNPVGAAQSDAANTLTVGAGGQQVGWFCFDNTIWTSTMMNRHRWYGVAPGGPSTLDVWHPMWTTATANKGTATADMTVGASTMVAIPKVERMHGSGMGCGR